MSKIKLFCIPFAGGSATIYNKWKNHIDPKIDIIPIELAGRGARFCEDQYIKFQECVDDVFDKIIKHHINEPYAIWGHSMGSSITFEVTRKIIKEKKNKPIQLFFSARRCPQSIRPLKEMHTLPQNEFIEELKKLGGVDDSFFGDKELMEIYIPIIRNDYKMLSTYQYRPLKEKMDIPFTILYGLSDDIHIEEIKGWEMMTSNKCEFLSYEGSHFYINEKYPEIVDYINKVLIHEN